MLRRLREALPDAFWDVDLSDLETHWIRERLVRPRFAVPQQLLDAVSDPGKAGSDPALPLVSGLSVQESNRGGGLEIDRLGFYLPYHAAPSREAGIHLSLSGLGRLAGFLSEVEPELGRDESAMAAQLFAFHHFEYHYRLEAFAIRLEVLLRKPAYRTILEATRSELRRDLEAQATASAVRATTRPLHDQPEKEGHVERAMLAYLERHDASGAADLLSPMDCRDAQYRLMEALRSRVMGEPAVDDAWIWHPVFNLFAPVPGVHAFLISPAR
ncbi:MAG: hypothetical protein WBX15_19310 [Thermoanaerobaculia bacterium]